MTVFSNVWSGATVVLLLSAVGCQSSAIESESEDERLGSVSQATTVSGTLRPGLPAADCCHFAEMRSDGSVRYAVSFGAPQQYVEVFVRQNGIQNVAHNIVSSQLANADGTFTYDYVLPASKYRAGDQILVRFYSYEPGKPGVFTPGPAQDVWAAPMTYGSQSCFAAYTATDGECAARQAVSRLEQATTAYIAGTGSAELISAAAVSGFESVARSMQAAGQLSADLDVAADQLIRGFRQRALANVSTQTSALKQGYAALSADQATLQGRLDYLQQLKAELSATDVTTIDYAVLSAVPDTSSCLATQVHSDERTVNQNQLSDLLGQLQANMQEMQMSFNLQYLQLQQKMQDESRRFTLLSNIMKTKHDTAKNSISNIR